MDDPHFFLGRPARRVDEPEGDVEHFVEEQREGVGLGSMASRGERTGWTRSR